MRHFLSISSCNISISLALINTFEVDAGRLMQSDVVGFPADAGINGTCSNLSLSLCLNPRLGASSHASPTMPALRIDTEILRNDRSMKQVLDFHLAVSVALELCAATDICPSRTVMACLHSIRPSRSPRTAPAAVANCSRCRVREPGH